MQPPDQRNVERRIRFRATPSPCAIAVVNSGHNTQMAAARTARWRAASGHLCLECQAGNDRRNEQTRDQDSLNGRQWNNLLSIRSIRILTLFSALCPLLREYSV